jgi:hypothetical protein
LSASNKGGRPAAPPLFSNHENNGLIGKSQTNSTFNELADYLNVKMVNFVVRISGL